MPQAGAAVPERRSVFHSLFVYTRVERRSATAWDAGCVCLYGYAVRFVEKPVASANPTNTYSRP
eukprot:scaffold82583_cov60-Phaeocystis_antarctica.AAC.4